MVRFRLHVAAGVVAVVVACTVGARLEAQDVSVQQSTGAWFVELNGPVDTFRSQARGAGVDFSERYVFGRLWRGLSVNTTTDGAALLRRLPSVRAVFPVLPMSLDPAVPLNPELAHALTMTGADLAQASGLTGAGIKVGVMDTGIDYHHPDLGGGFGPGSRVVTGYDFVGDRYDGGGSGGALIPHPDRDPDDCNSHGTHVAGIIGASGNPATGGARGVAPGVTFGAYKVFGCDGSTSADVMIAAMERALADGMQVLNISIGSAFQTWPQYPTAVAADALVDAGVVVVTSIGNSGTRGVYSASAPGVGRKVIGTASFDNSHLELPYFTAAPDDRRFSYLQAAAAPSAPTTGTALLARTGTPASAADGCSVANADGVLVSPFAAGSLAGKVALIRRGTCSFYEKSRNAEVAGAVAVVLYNNVAGYISPTVAAAPGAPPITIPVVAVLASDGVALSDRLPAAFTSTLDITWTDQTASFPNPTAGTTSSFSSYGLNAELQLKPNIGAPGGLIRSTVPLEMGEYDTFSGTSMASPHVAGAAALFLETHPGSSPADVQTALQNSADPAPLFGFSNRDAVHRQGAGMLDIDDAIAATTRLTPSELSLGEGTAAHVREITIANMGTAAVTYNLSHLPAVGTRGSTFAPIPTINTAMVTFGAASVLVQPGDTATVTVSITPNTSNPLLDRSVYGGYIEVTGGGSTYRVPYAGFTGDYQSVQVLAPGGCSFPGVFKVGGQTTCAAGPPAVVLPGFTRQANNAIFNVEQRPDRPVLLFHLAHQSQRLEIFAIDEVTKQSHLVLSEDYLPRNPSNTLVPGSFFGYAWDGKKVFTNAAGKVRRNELPAGLYRLRVVVTKARALGDTNPAAYLETWTSDVLNIVR